MGVEGVEKSIAHGVSSWNPNEPDSLSQDRAHRHTPFIPHCVCMDFQTALGFTNINGILTK